LKTPIKNPASVRSIVTDILILVIPILVIPFIYTEKLLDPVLIPRFLALAIFLLPFLLLIIRRHSGDKSGQTFAIINNAVFLSYSLLIIVSGISLFYSTNFADGLFEWLKLFLSFIFLLLLVVHFQNSEHFFTQLSKMVSVFSVAISVIGIYQFVQLTGKSELSHSAVYNISATFAHKNLFAQILLFSLPFSIYAALSFKSTFKMIGVLAVLLALCNITLSLSRGVWIAATTAIVATAILALVIEHKESTSILPFRVRLFWPALILVLAVSGSILLYSYLDSFETIQRQIYSIVDAEHTSTKDRLLLWNKSFQLFKEHPLAGHGLGTWKIEILKLGTEGMRSSDNVTFFQRPHNDFVWILTEAGIWGLLAFVALFTMCFYYLGKVLRATQNLNSKRICYLMFMGLISYVLCSSFSFPKERIEHLILLTFIIAPIIIEYNQIKTTKAVNPQLITAGLPILGLVLVLSIAVGIKRINAEYHVSQALQSREKGDWNAMIEHCSLAESAFYRMDPASTPISWYTGLANYNVGKQEEAFLQFQNAYEIHPYHIHVLNNLGTSYEILGNHQQAINYYTKAVKISPYFEEALLNLSVVSYKQGNKDEAYEYIRKVDVKSTNPKFRSIVNIMIIPATEQMIQTVEEQVLKMTIARILNSDEWMYDIHSKSVENDRTFRKQLLMDTFHTLTTEDNILTFNEAERLRAKYGMILL